MLAFQTSVPPCLAGSTFCSTSTGALGQAFQKYHIVILSAAPFLPQIFWTEIRVHTCLSADSESQLLWEVSLPTSKKPLNSQMIHPVLLEGVGPQAYVLCNWYGYMQWVQMGFLHLNSPVSASSQKIHWAALSLRKPCLPVITAWNRGYRPGKPARQPYPGRSSKAGSLESLSLGEEKSSPMVEEKTTWLAETAGPCT